MSLARAFVLSSIVLAAAAFGTLALAADLSSWIISLGWAAFALCLAQTIVDRQRVPFLFRLGLSSVTWNLLLVLAFIAFWIDLLWISQELLAAGIHFLIVLIVNKLFNLEQRRDSLHLYAVSLMAILASAALTVDLWYAALLVLFLFAGVWSLLLYHLTKEREETDADGPADAPLTQKPEWITVRFFWTANALAACALCLTLSIFFILPRVGIGFMQHGRGDNLRAPGFSDKVDLGVMGTVKQDPSIVMRVEVTGATPHAAEPLYLRGMAYDRYNGTSWSNSFVHRRNLIERPAGRFTVRSTAAPLDQPPAATTQNILLEALDTSVLFAVPQPVSLSGDFVAVQSDSMGVLYLPFAASAGRVQYSVHSRPPHVLPAEASAATLLYPEIVRRQYLQLPSLRPEIAKLAGDITRAGRTTYESVLLIKHHLLGNYRYSLEIGPGSSSSPLEDFLFIRKTGYCEHYASAMVAMLRSIGIPSRLVTGFLATEWNSFGQYYTVRQRDAHAWVEVYFPESGWISFDPTPAEPAGAPSPWWQQVDGALDSMRLHWDRLVIQYGVADQLSMIQNVRDGGDALWQGVGQATTVWVDRLLEPIQVVGKEWTAFTGTRTHGWVAVPAIVIGLWILVILVKLLRTRPQVHVCESNRDRTAAQWYCRMLDMTAARGFPKPSSHTPMEFARHIERNWADASAPVGQLTELYYRARFGQSAITEDDVRAAESLIQQLGNVSKPADPVFDRPGGPARAID
jgi:transglutaminase-like putative cysteine protease